MLNDWSYLWYSVYMTDAELREYRHILRNGDKDAIREFQERIKYVHSFPESFFDYMYDMIKRSRRTLAMNAQRAGLSKDYMYKILNPNSGKRTYERDYIIAFCVAADMSFMETQHALELYPFPLLDDRDDRSAVIIVALLDNMGIDALNEMLENAGHSPLRTSPDMKKTTIGPARSTIIQTEDVFSNHDEELIAAVIRRMQMKNEEKIDLWDEMIGCMPCTYATNAEMKIIDDNGAVKFVQLYMSNEISSFSVSTHSLHDFNPEDDDKCWKEETCEEVFDTFMAEEAIAEIEDEDEADRFTNYSMMIRMASVSKYYSLYLKLDAAVDSHIFGPGTEIEIERAKKEILGEKPIYKVTREYQDSRTKTHLKHKEEYNDISDIDVAIKKAQQLYDDTDSLPKDWMLLEVRVFNSNGKIVWDNGYRY